MHWRRAALSLLFVLLTPTLGACGTPPPQPLPGGTAGPMLLNAATIDAIRAQISAVPDSHPTLPPIGPVVMDDPLAAALATVHTSHPGGALQDTLRLQMLTVVAAHTALLIADRHRVDGDAVSDHAAIAAATARLAWRFARAPAPDPDPTLLWAGVALGQAESIAVVRGLHLGSAVAEALAAEHMGRAVPISRVRKLPQTSIAPAASATTVPATNPGIGMAAPVPTPVPPVVASGGPLSQVLRLADAAIHDRPLRDRAAALAAISVACDDASLVLGTPTDLLILDAACRSAAATVLSAVGATVPAALTTFPADESLQNAVALGQIIARAVLDVGPTSPDES